MLVESVPHILTRFPPKHRGEFEVFEQISGLTFEGVWFWFSLDFIPGVADIDMLIWSESFGLVSVEIKAVPIGMIKSLSYQTCEIAGRGVSRSPQVQAYDAAESFRLYLQPLVARVPFVSSTVCWPLITRDEWKIHFRGNSDIANLSEKFLMRDDVYNTPSTLVKRLGQIISDPPTRKRPDRVYVHDSRIFNEVCALINPEAVPNPSRTDLDRLNSIESGLRRDVVKLFPPSDSRRVIFSGKPGTGKTYRLFQVGVLHSREERRVLLTCFNKVLASEFRRTFNLISKTNLTTLQLTDSGPGQLEALDIFGLARRVVTDLDLKINPEVDTFDEWGELVVSEYKSWLVRHEAALYDTVLIDECQDFKRWQLELALSLVKPLGTVVIGLGGAQELYSEPFVHDDFFAELTRGYKLIHLKRNFRNSPPVYKLAHLVLDCGFDSENIDRSYSSTFGRKKRTDAEVEFEIHENRFPTIFSVDDLSIDIASPDFKRDRDRLVIRRYAAAIRDALQRLPPGAPLRELLLLVPREGEEAVFVREALAELKREDPNLNWIDYVSDKMRGSSSPEQMIRLVTFHSCRGLDALSTVVFGIDMFGIDGLPTQAQSKLAHIVLSRSIFEMTIVMRTSRSGFISEFIDAALGYIHNADR